MKPKTNKLFIKYKEISEKLLEDETLEIMIENFKKYLLEDYMELFEENKKENNKEEKEDS